ncbi:serine/threonine protein phosphatase [Corynebacterium phocae]|uniref:Serine/threonine protein phosphatase n=1 Tax=Corynebacterium phocae TaxID=161895 RepID=A0A1L7D2N9_9CORY|nr:metallophosphoesterase [Corynebacterium phocae]APT92343.1 serine/threonine protein phosphatase [Corynebacterium phocae]KAA8724935.1 metallophosphoesterase [Corynebacterium phocae]
MATLWATADLHAAVKANYSRLDELVPPDPADWLIVAGDVAERVDLVLKVLKTLSTRYAQVIWVPGNHELFSRSQDQYRGRDRYNALVRGCREIGVITPEDAYPVFAGVTIAPLFTLYDYSFRPPQLTVEQALELAYEKNIIMTDEIAIAPFVDIRAWCWDRLAYSTKRLSRVTGPTILVNHWPLVREPTLHMRWAEIALWCGTRHTRSWPRRYNALAVIYGHLHMPGVEEIDGVKHIEVSLGYPRDWNGRDKAGLEAPFPVKIMDDSAAPGDTSILQGGH